MDEVKAVADILQDALKKIQTVAGSTTTSSVFTLPPTGSSVQNSAASPSFEHNISNTPRPTAQNINSRNRNKLDIPAFNTAAGQRSLYTKRWNVGTVSLKKLLNVKTYVVSNLKLL